MARRSLLFALLAACVLLAYSNHFQNSFHFDDFHTITDNPRIRSLANVPRFFTDPTTFSTLPTHQVYRPVLSTSLALDYRVAGGYHPWVFHASSLCLFAAQLLVMFLLLRRMTPGRDGAALFATAAYGLHPVCAETVNYVIQRGEILSTLGVLGGLLLYAAWPGGRRWGVYLVPFAFGALSKPPALVFPLLLLLWIVLFEAGGWRKALRAALPALIAAAALAALLQRMIAPTFSAGAGDALAYRVTQTWVTLHYLAAFFWPARLCADSAVPLLTGVPWQAWLGALAVAGVAAGAVLAGRHPEWKAVSFGLAWFLIALAPTALMPLAEAANDHRMYFAFGGLAMALCGVSVRIAGLIPKPAWVAAGCSVLLAAGIATYQRNRVWRSEETLWLDVTRKAPHNGRGWMNYGLTRMAKADYTGALDCFDRARRYSPSYWLLEINTAIAQSVLGRQEEAEALFHRAAGLAPAHPASHFYYGRWLLTRKRYGEAIGRLSEVLRLQPADLPARHLLMQAHFEQQNWSALGPLADTTLKVDATDATARHYLSQLEDVRKTVDGKAGQARTAEQWLDLSLSYYRAGRFEDCVEAARTAARLRPGFAAAYNNMAAGYNSLRRWEEAIGAAREAVRLNPADGLARNNLAWALAQQKGGTAR